MKIKAMTNRLKVCAVALALTVALAGCTSIAETASDDSAETSAKAVSGSTTIESVETLSVTDKDLATDYDESEAVMIDLSKVTGIYKITEEGTYICTGTASDATIAVEVSEEEDVQIVLRDASITSSTSAAIYVISADEVYITLEGENYLANGGTFEAIDENDIDAVIYSKDDLTINGDGSVEIGSPAGHGIVCKDDLVIASGTYEITASVDGINTNDSVAVVDADITVEAGDDAIHTDGMMQIDGGVINVTAAEGLEGTYVLINGGDITISASDDGINAGQKSDAYIPTVEINGGNITITMGQGDTDGIDSNGNIIINGGTVNITGQSTCDYDGTAELNGGTLIVNGQEVDTIPNQFMGGAGGMGGAMMGGQMDQMGPQGNSNFDPASSGNGQFPSDFDPDSIPQMPDGEMPGGVPGGRGQRPDRQQTNTNAQQQ